MAILTSNRIHRGHNMYIYKIKIENFRTIKHMEWKPRKDINIIIGPNGGGKTTLATALDYLLNPYLQWYNKALSEMDYYDRDINNSILIEVWFKDVDNFVEEDGELLFEHINDNDKISEDGQELVLITRFKAGSDRKGIHTIVSNGKEQPFKQAYKGLLNYKYIEAERDPLKELSFVSNSILSKIIRNDELNDVLQNIIEEFNNNSSSSLMSDPYFKKVLEELGSNFANFDLVANDEIAIGVEATELTERKTLQAFSLVCKNKNLNNYIPIKYQSRGIKNLMLLLAIQENIKELGILFLEEPEQNLEPTMQRKIMKSIMSQNNGQAFFVTHSPEVVKMFEFDKIFIMQNGMVKSLPSVDNKFEKHLERFAKHQLLSGLFSKCVLLVEGDAEESGIPILSNEWDDTIDDCGIQVIKCVGKDNIPKYADFYGRVDILNISLLDNDKDIKNQLRKYNTQKIKSLVITVPKDYEDALIQLQIFQEHWKELFLSRYSFDKEFYLKPFTDERNSKSKPLKDIYVTKKEIQEINSLDELENCLGNEMLLEYQHEFLHMFMAGIVEARYVLYFLIEKGDKGTKNYIPKSYMSLFKLIRKWTNNNLKCDEEKPCIIHCNPEADVHSCCKCANRRNDYSNTFQIRGVKS